MPASRFIHFIIGKQQLQSRKMHNGVKEIMAYFLNMGIRAENKKFSLLFAVNMIVCKNNILEGSMLLQNPAKERKHGTCIEEIPKNG